MTPSVQDLLAVVPQAWVHPSELRYKRARRQYKNACLVLKGRVCFPTQAWQWLGEPSHISFFIEGYDVLIVGSTEFKVHHNSRGCYVLHSQARALKFFNRGVYDESQWRLRGENALRHIRITRACFANITRKYVTHWRELEGE